MEAAWCPDYVGTEQKRFFRFENGKILRAPSGMWTPEGGTKVIYNVSSMTFTWTYLSFDDDTPLELIRRLKPDVLVKGGDYTIDAVVGAKEVEAAGGRVVLVDLVDGRSTTRLIDAIRQSHSPAEADAARARSSEDAA